MSEMLEWLLKLKKESEEEFEDSDTNFDIVKYRVFTSMEKYLRLRLAQELSALVDTILEGDDLKREVTARHEKAYEDMDKFFEIIGKKIPTESQKAEQTIECVDGVLETIQEIRAKKKEAKGNIND